MNLNENTKCVGEIEISIENKDGSKETRKVKNTVLLTGKEALASSLANNYGANYPFFINRMLFGRGGTTDGTPRFINGEQTALYEQILSKPVTATIDHNFPYQVVFTSVVSYEDVSEDTINEMALQMGNEDLYSMATFGDIHKTSAMQIMWSWRLSFL
jgi:hypothetical protein